ncbi:hypothetical protein BHE74_00019757 [Ensete ventricosum]|nr:hypothetical protein BHE74_00019757 [Ensete ventricosum]
MGHTLCQVHTEIFFSNGDIWQAHNTKEKLERHLKVTGGKHYLTSSSFYQVTYTSDYFEELYDLAVKLIHKGLAYVDHQSPEEVKEYREKKMNSPWRDRPIAESLKLFEDMRQGFIDEGKATLRLKQDMQNHNKNMYDLIAYRIKVEEIEGEPRTTPLSNGEAVVRLLHRVFRRRPEMSVAGESRDDPTNEENLARRRLLRHGLLLVAFSSSEVKRKRGGLGDIADVSPHSCWEEKTRTCEWFMDSFTSVTLAHQDPAKLEDWLSDLNPHSKEVIPEAYAVPSLTNAVLGDKFQFERLGNLFFLFFYFPLSSSDSTIVSGYFAVDPDSTSSKLVLNRTTTLRDSYCKGAQK